jgi:hypothetical protein
MAIAINTITTTLSCVIRGKLVALLMISSCSVASAGSFMDSLIDPEDGWLDGGQVLLDYHYGVLPVPIIITEPSVGNGFGLAAVHFHDAAKDVGPTGTDSRGRTIPMSISALAVGGTENGTRFAGGAHIGHYNRDTVRTETIAGYGDVFMDFYGTSIEPSEQGASFNSEALVFMQVLTFRLKESNWFAGGAYRLVNTDTTFELGNDIPGISDNVLQSANAAIGAVIRYDSLENQYNPDSGFVSDLQLARFDQSVGGDFNYSQATWLNQVHFSLSEEWKLRLRLDSNNIDGDAPFYALPYIELKGVPVLRYQGKNVLTTEARLDWGFHPRWQVGVFVGAGRAANNFDELADAPSRISRGVGFRYMGIRRLGLNMGVDVARGPEETSIYISFGTRW